jgi:hypothetical protein
VKEEAAPTEDLLAAYVSAKTMARAYYDITIGGSEYSQFDEDARSTFLALIEAEEAKDQSTLTATELAEAASALEAGLATYKMALNSDPQGEGNFYRWFTLESAVNPGKFLTVHPVNETLYIADADETDNQLFRFEARPDFVQGETTTTGLYDIICKGTPGTWDVPGTIRCEGGDWAVVYGDSKTNFSTGNGDWNALGYFPWQVLLNLGENGAQVALVSAVGDGVGAAEGAETVTNIYNAAYDGAASWKITYVETTVDVKTAQQSNIKIYTTNRMIVVKGTDAPVNVYNISGVEVDARKALRQGVYIVKVDGTTTKVVVE